MNEINYKRQPGDYEIRLLKDGRMVLVGPNQELLDMAKDLSEPATGINPKKRNTDDSTPPRSASVPSSEEESTTSEHHE